MGLFDTEYMTINNVEVDLHKIIRAYSFSKLSAAMYLSQIAVITIPKAKEIIYPLFEELLVEIKQVSYKDRTTEQKELDLIKKDIKKPSSFKAQMEIANKNYAAKQAEKIAKSVAEKARTKEMDKEGVVYCPKCHSVSISANRKGFSLGKAIVGSVIFSPVGAVAGLGSKKVEITCLKCGYKWKPGK